MSPSYNSTSFSPKLHAPPLRIPNTLQAQGHRGGVAVQEQVVTREGGMEEGGQDVAEGGREVQDLVHKGSDSGSAGVLFEAESAGARCFLTAEAGPRLGLTPIPSMPSPNSPSHDSDGLCRGSCFTPATAQKKNLIHPEIICLTRSDVAHKCSEHKNSFTYILEFAYIHPCTRTSRLSSTPSL